MSAPATSADPALLLRKAREQGRIALDEPGGKAILAYSGIAVPGSCTVAGPEQVSSTAATLRAPYVVKAVSPEIIHKSEFGAVKVGLTSLAEVESAIRTMRDAIAGRGIAVPCWLVEEMAPAGVECVVGGTMDPEFGPMVMVGLGGVFVEIMGDVSFRICPIERHDAEEMVAELKGLPLLQGARGRVGVSIEALVDVLMKLGGGDGILMRHADELSEVDINPLIVTRDAAFAADARFILRTPGAET